MLAAGETGPLLLCYKFTATRTPFTLFPGIRAAVIRFDKVSPQGTGVGCSSQLTIRGSGFVSLLRGMEDTGPLADFNSASMPNKLPTGMETDVKPGLVDASARMSFASRANNQLPLVCGFEGSGTTPAAIINDTHIACRTPSPKVTGTMPMRVDLGNLTVGHPATFPTFGVFNASESRIATLLPAGGAYNLRAPVDLVGSFTDYGEPRCAFGDWIGSWATVLNATHAVCEKPRFPDTARDSVGAYSVSFSPNGQCFSSRGTAAFRTYNSQVNKIRVRGAPAQRSMWMDIEGEGFVFPGLEGGTCRFVADDANARASTAAAAAETRVGRRMQAQSSEMVETPLEVISPTQCRCATPATNNASTWKVQVLQNGLTKEPALFGDPRFREYDVSDVRISSLMPPGGPVGVATAVVVRGSGFEELGDGQLACRVGGANGALVPGLLLSAERIRCLLPAATDVGSAAVTVSLNNGTDGTFSADQPAFQNYAPPFLDAVSPTGGSADGGTIVTITGQGFSALSTDAAVRAALMRCTFGRDEGVSVKALTHTDTSVVCVTPWGEEGAQPVRVALNGISTQARVANTPTTGPGTLANISHSPLFYFVGLHPPALVEAYFPPEGTTLVIRFDSQPTNRAGMNGVSACSQVLDDATSAQLRGSAKQQAQCYWMDDSTLVAQLTMNTLAAGGMTVTVRNAVLWPKAWVCAVKDCCYAAESQCQMGGETTSVTVDVEAGGGGGVAFFVRLRALDAAGSDVLPATWSDNFITVLAGEHANITLQYEPGRTVQRVTAEAFNH